MKRSSIFRAIKLSSTFTKRTMKAPKLHILSLTVKDPADCWTLLIILPFERFHINLCCWWLMKTHAWLCYVMSNGGFSKLFHKTEKINKNKDWKSRKLPEKSQKISLIQPVPAPRLTRKCGSKMAAVSVTGAMSLLGLTSRASAMSLSKLPLSSFQFTSSFFDGQSFGSPSSSSATMSLPKRPKPGYTIFSEENRPRYAEQFKGQPQKIMVALGRDWSQLSDEQREVR